MIVHALESIQISNDNTYWVPLQTNYRNSEFCKAEFQFSVSPDIGISKKNPTRIFGIENGIGIPLTIGVPEIGTKNQNSQPSLQTCHQRALPALFPSQCYPQIVVPCDWSSHLQSSWRGGIHHPKWPQTYAGMSSVDGPNHHQNDWCYIWSKEENFLILQKYCASMLLHVWWECRRKGSRCPTTPPSPDQIARHR